MLQQWQTGGIPKVDISFVNDNQAIWLGSCDAFDFGRTQQQAGWCVRIGDHNMTVRPAERCNIQTKIFLQWDLLGINVKGCGKGFVVVISDIREADALIEKERLEDKGQSLIGTIGGQYLRC